MSMRILSGNRSEPSPPDLSDPSSPDESGNPTSTTSPSTSSTDDGPGSPLPRRPPLVSMEALKSLPEFGLDTISDLPPEGTPQLPDKEVPRSAWQSRVQALLSKHPHKGSSGTMMTRESALALPGLTPGPSGSWRGELNRLRDVNTWIKAGRWAPEEMFSQGGPKLSYPRLQAWMEDRGAPNALQAATTIAAAQVLGENLPSSDWWGVPTVQINRESNQPPARLYFCQFPSRPPKEGQTWEMACPWTGEAVGTGQVKAPPFKVPEAWWGNLVVPAILDGLVVQVAPT